MSNSIESDNSTYSSPPSSSLMTQLFRFLIVGGISFLLDFGLFTILYQMGMQHLIASSISFSISVILNYILTRKFVFTTSREVNVVKEFTLYIILNIIALGLNGLILFLCTDLLHASAYIGKIAATGIVLIFNFITRKLLLERVR